MAQIIQKQLVKIDRLRSCLDKMLDYGSHIAEPK
jgi:hypothetical protein